MGVEGWILCEREFRKRSIEPHSPSSFLSLTLSLSLPSFYSLSLSLPPSLPLPSQGIGRRLIAKVADFGLSRKLLLSPELQERVVDNPTWLAPEILSCKPYTEKVDVYSFAVILWEMLVRLKPYAELEFMWEIQEMVLRGEVRAVFALSFF